MKRNTEKYFIQEFGGDIYQQSSDMSQSWDLSVLFLLMYLKWCFSRLTFYVQFSGHSDLLPNYNKCHKVVLKCYRMPEYSNTTWQEELAKEGKTSRITVWLKGLVTKWGPVIRSIVKKNLSVLNSKMPTLWQWKIKNTLHLINEETYVWTWMSTVTSCYP